MAKLKFKKKPVIPLIIFKLDYTKEDIILLTNIYLKKGIPIIIFMQLIIIIYIPARIIIYHDCLSWSVSVLYIGLLSLLIFYKPIRHKVLERRVGRVIKINLNHQSIITSKNKVYRINRKLSYIDINYNIIMFIKRFNVNVPYLIKPSSVGNEEFEKLTKFFSN